MSFPDIETITSVETKRPHPQSVFADHSDIVVGASDRSEAEVNQQLYEYGREMAQDWMDNMAVEGESLYAGNHWTEEQRSALLARGQMPTTIQATFQLTEQAVDMLTANNPAFRATPVEDSDVALASAWSDLFSHMWYQSQGQLHMKQVVRDSYVQGRGVAFVYIDPNKDSGRGEVVWRALEPKSVFPDPECTHPLWDDAAWVIVRTPMTYYQLRQIDEEAADRLKEKNTGRIHGDEEPWVRTRRPSQTGEIGLSGDAPDAYARDKYEVLERYEKIKVPYVRLYNPTTGTDKVFPLEEMEAELAMPAVIIEQPGQSVTITTDLTEIAGLMQVYEQIGPEHHQMQDPETGETYQMPGPPHEGSVPGSHVIITPTSVGVLIDMELLPAPVNYYETRIRLVMSCGDEMITDPVVLPISNFPVVPLPASHNRTPFPMSDVMRVRDMQDVINKSLSLILAHAANSTNMKVFYPDGSLIDADDLEQRWGKAGTAFIPYDSAYGGGGGAPGGIVIASPPPLPNALYANMDRAYQIMERTLGLYSFQEGNIAASPRTYRGTLAIDEMGQRRIKGKMDMVYATLTRIGEVMRDYAQFHYTQEKVLRLEAPSGDITTTVINYDRPDELAGKLNDIASGRIDIRILGGSTLPNNRWAKLQVDMEMYSAGIIDDIAVLKHSEFPDANQILERKSIYSQLQGALQQYQDQIKGLEGDLQTWQREAQHAKQKAELEKFKGKLNDLLGSIKVDADKFNYVMREKRKQEQQMRQQMVSQQQQQQLEQ